jgi:hypothetical protein
MTFDELDGKLPNGFRAARLYELGIDYVNGTAVLRMGLDVGSPDGPKQEDYRVGKVRVSGLYFCMIDHPDPYYRYMPHGSPVTVYGSPATPDILPQLALLSETFVPGVACYRFRVHESNSFIHIAAKDVQIFWVDEGITPVP